MNIRRAYSSLMVLIVVANMGLLTPPAIAVFAPLWQINGIFVASNKPHEPQLVSDGAGGAIIVWYGSDLDSDIYAQRVDAEGTLLWRDEGQIICSAPNNQIAPSIISDGEGGAITVWTDFRSGTDNDVYAQRMNSEGKVLWRANGIPIATGSGDQVMPVIASDGSGGAIVAWQDERGEDGDSDIYAQRITKDGKAAWARNGALVASMPSSQTEPVLTTDGAGGAIIAWQDMRAGEDINIYAQRIGADGKQKWPPGGVAVCTAKGNQGQPAITSEPSREAVISWTDGRGVDEDIYAQKVDLTGNIKWTPDGVAVCTALGNQLLPRIVSNDSGGAVIGWVDTRGTTAASGYAQQAYMQRIDADGRAVWEANGIFVNATVLRESSVHVQRVGRQSLVYWVDQRNGLENIDIYAQLVNDEGKRLWKADGEAVVSAPRGQAQPTAVATGAKSAIFVWLDGRSGVGAVYAQKAEDARFKDVTTLHWAYEYISFLADRDIIEGYPNNLFYPDRSMTRAEFVKIIILAIGKGAPSASSSHFADVADGFWAKGYIERAKELGIVAGYPDGTFRPNNSISRQEIAKIVILAGGFTPETDFRADFPDATEDLWSWPYVLEAANQNIITAYPDGAFRPTNTATRAEASKMVAGTIEE
ncbi:MAG: S-layer homology domain-containing protein [Actinomycetota bacterium]|nr:S-layer homology domain-containing protein [Actinomycetota bacterium]